MGTADGDVGLAFALTIGAGLSTLIGAAIALFVKIENYKILSFGLGISAGVMVYVSFVEIFSGKAVDAFITANGEKHAHLTATACFFAGILIMVLIEVIVHKLDPGHTHDVQQVYEGGAVREQREKKHHVHLHEISHVEVTVGPSSSSTQPPSTTKSTTMKTSPSTQALNEYGPNDGASNDNDDGNQSSDDSYLAAIAEKSKLNRTGLMTALSLGIHNFPEGLATFVAALADTSLGVALAVAIAIHNIPEGLCVALPIYYATGSKWRAFGWAFLSGISEPIGALLGYIVLAQSFDDRIYGTLFGLVAGMMVYISIRELLPTARKYDPEDQVTTLAFVIGMFVMALSLILFLY